MVELQATKRSVLVSFLEALYIQLQFGQNNDLHLATKRSVLVSFWEALYIPLQFGQINELYLG
jgi:hypothetical protein